MKKLKRTTISKCEEELTDVESGKSLPKISKTGNGKVSTKVSSLKLCQLCQKRPGVSLHCGKWSCRSCRGKAFKQKVGSKKLKTEVCTNDAVSVKDIISSGAFKSMLTIQIQSDGKRSVKEKSDCKELSKEKDLSLIEDNQTFSTATTKFTEVEDSRESVVNEDNPPGNKETTNDVQLSRNSARKNNVNNMSCVRTKENNIIRRFNTVSSHDNAATKFKLPGAKTRINHRERVNGDISEVRQSSSINSPSINNNILEKSSCEFPLEPDSSLFGCVETCFDYLEEVDLDLFYEYVYRAKKSKNLSIGSKAKSANDICAIQNLAENNQNSIEDSNNEHELDSRYTEIPKELSMPNCDKQNKNDCNKEMSDVVEETAKFKKSSDENLSPTKQETVLLTRLAPTSNSAKKRPQNSEISESDSLVTDRTNGFENEASSMKCKSSLLKENCESFITSSLLDGLPSLQNESQNNQYNETEPLLHVESPKKTFSEGIVENVITNSNKTATIGGQLPVVENTISNSHDDFSLLTEKEMLSIGKIDQYSTSTLNDATAELNLLSTESQHSGEKSVISTDLYSNEDESLDYEPEDEEVPSVETLNFKVSAFQKADFDEVMDSVENEINSHLFDTSSQIKSALQTVKSERKKKKCSVWEVDSDEDDSDDEKGGMPLNSSSPELLCTVDEDEENYIDDKVVSQSSSKKSDVPSHTLTSSVAESSTVREQLQIEKGNASTRNEIRNIPDVTGSENANKTYKKLVPTDNTTAAFQNMSKFTYDKPKGYCYQFLRKGRCNRKYCKFVHARPPSCNVNDNKHRVLEIPQHSQNSRQSHHPEYTMKENVKSNIGPDEGKNILCKTEPAYGDRNKDQYLKQFGAFNSDRYETNPTRDQFQTSNNYNKSFDQRNDNILQFVFGNHWNTLSHLFNCSFYNGTFVKHLKNAFCQQQMYAGSKFQQFINILTLQGSQELQREKVYILGQIGCSIILEAHSAGRYEVAFEVLSILHQHDINYYHLQHNINQSLGVPLWGIITSSWIVLVAVDTCVHLEKIAEAIQILEECNWALPSPELTPEIKKKETVMRINILQQLMGLTAKYHMVKFVVKILKLILDIYSEDTEDTDLRNSMSDSIKQVYKYYISTLIDNQDMDSAMSLYMYFWKLKPLLNLNPEIHRALIVLAVRNNRELRARNLFQTCANMGLYKLGEPNLSSLPHCLRVHTSWTSEEMQLALNHYLGQLLNNLLKWEKNFNELSSQELFSLHIVFNESPSVQQPDCLFHFLSPVRLHESRQRMIAQIEKLTFHLDFEQMTERTLRIKPSSLHSYFLLWKMDSGHADTDTLLRKDASFSSLKMGIPSSSSSSPKNLNISRHSDIDETADTAESTNDEEKHICSPLCNETISSSVSLCPFHNYNAKQGFNFDQAIGHSSHKERKRIVLHTTPVKVKYRKKFSGIHSSQPLLSEDGHDSETKESYTERGLVQKPRSSNVSSLVRNLDTCTTINSKTAELPTSSFKVPSINRSFSSAPPSRLKPPPSVNRSTSETKKLHLKSSVSLRPTYKKKQFLPQTPVKVNSNLIGKAKNALVKKYLTTPKKPTERIIKLKQRQTPSKQENANPLPLQKPSTNISSCDSSKVYNYIKSQLLCHHKGNSSDQELNRQAHKLTDKFINETKEKDNSSNTLLDRKRMKRLVDFTKLHINEKDHIV